MSRLYEAFFQRLAVRRLESDAALHLLSAAEVRNVQRVHHRALAISASFAVAGFLAYYLPLYFAPALFPTTTVTLPLVGRAALPLVETAWGLLLMVAEVYALVLLNVYSVHETAVATGYLTAENKPARAAAVLDVGLEKKHRGIARYGIDPFQDVNPWALFVFNLVLRLKGFLGNKVLRYLVRRLAGRFAVRAVLDFVGLPIYMAINAYATHAVLREARVVIMGRQLVELLAPRLPLDAVRGAADRALVYDTLQFIAVSKRDYHENHYALTAAVFERYAIEPEASHPVSSDYLERLAAAPDGVRAVCLLLVSLGFVLDGQISARERRRIAALHARGVLVEDAATLAQHCAAFVSGAGAEALVARYLGAPGAPAALASA